MDKALTYKSVFEMMISQMSVQSMDRNMKNLQFLLTALRALHANITV